MHKKNNILVIVVTYNAMKWAKRCFDSLRTSTVPNDVFVVDNGSTDGTQDYIHKYYSEVQLVQSQTNLGFGRANNIGFQKVLDENYEYAYLLNQDAWVMPDTFEKLIEESRLHPDFAILSPMQLEANENNLDYNFITNVIGRNQFSAPFLSNDLYFGHMESIYEVRTVMAAHWLMSRKCIETIGGFSPTFVHYGEDDNYMHRVAYWKMKAGIVTAAKAIHDREKRPLTNEKNYYINLYIIPLKESSDPNNPISISKWYKDLIVNGLKKRHKIMFGYGLRLFREKKYISANLEASKEKCAFLK